MPERPGIPDCIYAWVGEDEMGSGEAGLKQGLVPAGMIPLVVVEKHLGKIEKLVDQMNLQAKVYGKRIRLVRYVAAEIMMETAEPHQESAKGKSS